MRKNYFVVIFIFLLCLFTSNIVFASDDLSIDGEYVTKDPVTGNYSSDWSHLDTPENFQLQKDFQNYFLDMELSLKSGVEGTQVQIQQEYEEDLNKRIYEFLGQIDPEIKASLDSEGTLVISPKSSYGLPSIDSASLKILEGKLHLLVGALTPSEAAASFQNSNGAREHAKQYARDKKFYINGKLKTWNNASDALRHFAWNFMDSNDLGVNKARAVGDIHEVTLIALNYLNNDRTIAKLCNYGLSCMQSGAIRAARDDWNASKNSLTVFNRNFDAASVMDLLNNSKGRQAYLQGYSNYSQPFNILINNGTLIQFDSKINSTYRSSAWQGFR